MHVHLIVVTQVFFLFLCASISTQYKWLMYNKHNIFISTCYHINNGIIIYYYFLSTELLVVGCVYWMPYLSRVTSNEIVVVSSWCIIIQSPIDVVVVVVVVVSGGRVITCCGRINRVVLVLSHAASVGMWWER